MKKSESREQLQLDIAEKLNERTQNASKAPREEFCDYAVQLGDNMFYCSFGDQVLIRINGWTKFVPLDPLPREGQTENPTEGVPTGKRGKKRRVVTDEDEKENKVNTAFVEELISLKETLDDCFQTILDKKK
jgi:hypothetical protein